jgi:hypothetical protein
LIDVIEQAEWDILANTARTYVGGVETSTRDTFIKFLLSDIRTIAVNRARADVQFYLMRQMQ